jgi:hypothetical protein
MNKKAHFYEVTFADGHGTHVKILPGFKAETLVNECREEHVKVTAKSIRNWKDVSVLPSECGTEVVFRSRHKDEEIEIRSTSPGYEHLKQRYSAQYRDVEECLNGGV